MWKNWAKRAFKWVFIESMSIPESPYGRVKPTPPLFCKKIKDKKMKILSTWVSGVNREMICLKFFWKPLPLDLKGTSLVMTFSWKFPWTFSWQFPWSFVTGFPGFILLTRTPLTAIKQQNDALKFKLLY